MLAKRLADIAADLDKLTTDDDKQLVIEKADKLNHEGLVELFNTLLEYMQANLSGE